MRTRDAAGLTRPTAGWPVLLTLATLSGVAELQSAVAAVVSTQEESAAALVQAGKYQYNQRDFVNAGSSYSRAVELIGQQSGPTSTALVEPLIGLADVSVATHKPRAAIDNLQRAVTVVRRSVGLHDPSQYPLLARLTDLQSLLGDLDAASGSLGYMKRVSESGHGKRSIQHARELTEIADWQCRIGRFDEARRNYRQSISVLDVRGGEAGRIDALLGLARCCLQELSGEGIATTPQEFNRYRGPVLRSGRMNPESPAFRFHIDRFLRPEGEAAVRRAVLLAETTSIDSQRQLDVLLQAGDWFQIKDHNRAARAYYLRAHALALRIGPDQPLAWPVQVLYPVPPLALRYRGFPADATTERVVEMEFIVRADGHIDDERVVERGLGKSAVDEIVSALHASRFRPRVIDGKAVDTEGVRLRQAFRSEKEK